MHRVSMLENWPNDVAVQVLGAYGEPLALERLEGMSLARIFKLDFEDGAIIAKASPRGDEMRFYAETADGLRMAGVPIPKVDWTGYAGGEYWGLMEYLPGKLPQPSGTWEPDPRVVHGLVALHQATRIEGVTRATGEQPWTDRAQELALGFFDDDDAGTVATILPRVREAAKPLQAGWCWISGDPSPANWGVRDDGSAVLFDWELFRPGVPASDLAPVVPGLAAPEAFDAAATAYLAAAASAGMTTPWNSAELARDATVAKVVNVIAMLAAQATGAARIPEAAVHELVDLFPAWLNEAFEARNLR